MKSKFANALYFLYPHSDLGSRLGHPQAFTDGPHLNRTRTSGLESASLPLLVRRGQDGQVLGSGAK